MFRLTACLLLAVAQPSYAAPRCVLDPVAPKPAAAVLPAAACHKAPAAIATKLRAQISKKYSPTWDGGKAIVEFPCDGLGASIREIMIETGNGHGGTLGMWHAVRGTGGFDVRGIAFAGASMVSKQKSPPYELVSGKVSLTSLEAVRAALAAKVSEKQPPPNPNGAFGSSMSMSSHDFHILVRLVDDDGRVLEREFTGYEGSQDQDVFLGLELAGEALRPITSLKGAAAAPTVEDRALFAERFNVSVAHFDEPFYWWVMERYVELARYFGTRAIIPGLLTRLVVATPDRSKVDARTDALEALALITGWDARPGVSVEDAAAAYRRECK